MFLLKRCHNNIFLIKENKFGNFCSSFANLLLTASIACSVELSGLFWDDLVIWGDISLAYQHRVKVKAVCVMCQFHCALISQE